MYAGTPVFIDDKLTIYVHGWENQECVKFMSDQLTEWHHNRAKNPRKRWYPGDICVAERNSDGMYHRAKIQKVYAKQKQRKCLVKQCEQTKDLRKKFIATNLFQTNKFPFRFNGLILDTPKGYISRSYPSISISLTSQFK